MHFFMVYFILFYFPLGAWPGGTAMLTAAEIALDMINNRSDILPNYRLNLVYNNTNVSTPHTTDSTSSTITLM